LSPDALPCPRCGAPAALSRANRWRPFCSERCKLIDLGNWADERYRVPDREPPPSDAAADTDEPESA